MRVSRLEGPTICTLSVCVAAPHLVGLGPFLTTGADARMRNGPARIRDEPYTKPGTSFEGPVEQLQMGEGLASWLDFVWGTIILLPPAPPHTA